MGTGIITVEKWDNSGKEPGSLYPCIPVFWRDHPGFLVGLSRLFLCSQFKKNRWCNAHPSNTEQWLYDVVSPIFITSYVSNCTLSTDLQSRIGFASYVPVWHGDRAHIIWLSFYFSFFIEWESNQPPSDYKSIEQYWTIWPMLQLLRSQFYRHHSFIDQSIPFFTGIIPVRMF